MTRKLDHIVLPVADLNAARQRLAALGFTVAPDGRHPFGTANCCVYFSDGSFIEPLAVVDPGEAADAIRAGNVFVARDHVFRAMIGEEGVSAIVLSTDDAAQDQQRFEQAGVNLGDMLIFSRPFIDATGNTDTATFRLAFAGSPEIGDAFVFTCERVNAPKVDRSALTVHANGAQSVSRIVIDPDSGELLGLVGIAAEATVGSGKVNIGQTVIAASGESGADRAATVTAIAFCVADLHIVEELLRDAAVDFQRRPAQIVVPPASGQGVAFIFEADQ
jgi:hypothetical protein